MKNVFLSSILFVLGSFASQASASTPHRQIVVVPQGKVVRIHPFQTTITHPKTNRVLYTRNITPAKNFSANNDWRYASRKTKKRPDLEVATRYSRFNREMYDRFGHARFTFQFDNDFDAGTYRNTYFYGENHAHVRGKSVLDYNQHTHLQTYRVSPRHR